MVGRRYAIEMGAGLAGYMIALIASLLLLRHGDHQGLIAAIIAVMPMLPAMGICWAILRQLHRMDEMQRRMQLEALAMAFAGTALITFSYGFLENAGFPRVSMFAVWPLMATLWVIGLLLCRRRYA